VKSSGVQGYRIREVVFPHQFYDEGLAGRYVKGIECAQKKRQDYHHPYGNYICIGKNAEEKRRQYGQCLCYQQEIPLPEPVRSNTTG
jgi:hypothetical protein